MKFFQLFSRKPKTTSNETPTIPSLKSEELWQFIQKPEGVSADTRAADLSDIWAKAQDAAASATRGTGEVEWAMNKA
ncbi:MAG: hypothetical protein AB8F78_03765 [Saprospiraceae bacterium]